MKKTAIYVISMVLAVHLAVLGFAWSPSNVLAKGDDGISTRL